MLESVDKDLELGVSEEVVGAGEGVIGAGRLEEAAGSHHNVRVSSTMRLTMRICRTLVSGPTRITPAPGPELCVLAPPASHLGGGGLPGGDVARERRRDAERSMHRAVHQPVHQPGSIRGRPRVPADPHFVLRAAPGGHPEIA